MKHYLLQTANGLHTPPCSNSHGKSVHFFNFRFSLFTPLLVLFLLIVGNSPAWARPTIYGEGLPGLNASGATNWDSNTKEMSAYGEADTYYTEFLNVAATDNNKYRFKIAVNSGGDWWVGAMNSGNTNESMGNVDIVNGKDGDNQISFKMPFDGDVYIFYKSTNDDNSKAWIIAVPKVSAIGNTTAQSKTMKFDLLLKNNGWNTSINFIKNNLDALTYKYVTSYVAPACTSSELSSSKPPRVRYEAYTGSGSDKFGGKESPNSAELTTSVRRVIYIWDGNKNNAPKKYLIPTYPNRSSESGWKLWVHDGTNDISGDLLEGSVTVQIDGGKKIKYFITNSTSVTGPNTDNFTDKTRHSVNSFGGCYVDKTASSNVTFDSDYQIYNSNDGGVYKIGNIAKPIVAENDMRGYVTIDGSGAKDVTFNFDGGVITISAVDHGATPDPTPSGVTFDGSEYFFWNTNVSSWGTVLAGKDRTQFLQFKNTNTNATAHTKLAFLWEQTNTGGNVEGILAAKAPSGEWHQVRHCRVNADDWNEGAILGTGEGSTDWIDLQEGNYMYKESGSIKFTTRTAEHFKFFLSGTVALAGGTKEFNPWNGNGTLYTDRITKTLEAGTYKFKINPDMTIYDSRGGVNKWTNEFNWDDLDAANSSDNIKLRDGNNKEIWFDLDKRSEVTIACDGNKVTVVAVPAQQYTVTFNTDGGSTIAPIQVSDGSPVAQPADPTKAGYTFVKWQSNGSDYDFSSAVNSNITLNAVWAYKSIESVSLNESEHMTWVGNSNFTLTPTYSPSDLITKTVTWSSNNTSVATVSNGTVHAVGAGTATITCTITDMLGNQRSATCEVTVAACEMTTDNIYSMTVTSYNTYSGDEAILTNLWNESSDNDGPASMIITRLAFQKKEAGTTLYAYDDNGTVKVKEDASGDDVQWLLIPTGETYTPSWNNGNSCQLYYIKNKATGAYMHRGSVGVNTGNPDWFYSVTNTNATNTATDDYKWFFVYENENQRCIYVKSGVGGEKKSSYKLHTSNQYNSETNTHAAKPMLPVGRTADINAYAKSYNNTNDFNYNTYPNPNYLASLMNGSYYRMKENATVQANLTAPLVSGAVITVRLYADAATSVQLTKEDGTEVATINLTADTEFEYSYTVNNDSPLLGEDVFIIKAEDNHAGIASIKVTHTYVANPSDPELSWETDLNGGVTQSALGSKFQHVASSTLSSGAIHYASSDEAVATVAANGTVTPHSAGTTTITATIAAEGCYDEASISYNITLTEASLQEAIDATPVDGTLTLTHDYSENAVINKAITLDAQGYTIGDLTVEYEGDLTLSSELIVRDFTICAKAGNTSTPAASGQVRNASELKVNGNAYFLYTVDPSGHVQYGWYDFTVPFPINIVSGIKGIQGGVLKEDFRNGVDYAVMEYFGDKQAQGQYPYKKFSGVMQPKKLYTITLDNSYNYNTLRMQKTADGELVASESVTLGAYTGGDAINANWNGVGNGTLHHADADNLSADYVQVYQSGYSNTFLPVLKNEYSFVVGTAFMVQQEGGTMMLNQATHNKLLAPSRYQSAPATAIQIASEGKPFSDQLFITASETGGQAYTPGVDVAKAGELGSASVPQIWTNAYNSSLCVHEAQLINGKAQYKLSIYAPVAGAYTLTSKNIPADYSLYLTQNGMVLSELSDTYTLDLSKGITTEYGLLLTEIYNSPTAIENTQTDKIQTTKIIRNGVLYILHNGKVYNAQGAKVK